MNKQILNLRNIHAVLFDMDGTMVNNMHYHKLAWQKLTQNHGIDLTDEEFRTRFPGKKNKHLLQMVFGKHISEDEIKKLTEEKEEMYRSMYSKDIKQIPGLIELIQELKEKGIKVAVATSAPKENREFILEALGLLKTFDVIIGDEHVQKGKPDPEIFLKTAEALHVQPAHCLVFEDAPFGVEAAKAAGMKVIGLLTSHTKKELEKADMVISDYKEFEF